MKKQTNTRRTGCQPMIRNNCKNYDYLDGSPYPESEHSCRGCKNSADPDRYDPGCKLANGYDPKSSE